MTGDIARIFGLGPVIPVVQLDDEDDAVPMARALLAGGIRVVEITLRTSAALAAIRAVAKEVPEIAVGAGTLLKPDDLTAAVDAGAGFFVSPGLTPVLLKDAEARGLAYLPGAATSAEIMMALDHGFDRLKFFPAAPLGAETIKSFAGPFPQISFCTTGGITRDNAPTFLALPNVACVGASWVVTAAALQAKDWAAIEANARFAAGL
jgi:2-dehydro-3-deoxyphosphogluconate aldolase / (4S)-4-hydroxy-2-oxoglutarate aldolase